MQSSVQPQFNFKLFLGLVRALFPRWNFFDFVGFTFQVAFKVPDQKHWETLSFEIERNTFGLLLNPYGNMALAKFNILEHFVEEIQTLIAQNAQVSSQDLQKKVTYLMLVEILKQELAGYGLNQGVFQFKVTALKNSEEVDLFFSEWISLVNS